MITGIDWILNEDLYFYFCGLIGGKRPKENNENISQQTQKSSTRYGLCSSLVAMHMAVFSKGLIVPRGF